MVNTRNKKHVVTRKYPMRSTRNKRPTNDEFDFRYKEPLLQTCDLCHRQCKNKQDLLKHRAEHATVPVSRLSICKECLFYTNSPTLLQQHATTHLPVIIKSKKDDDQGLQEPICTTAPVVVAPDPVQTEVRSEIPDFSPAVFENPVPIRSRILYEQEPMCTTAPVVVAPDPVQTEVKSEIPDFSPAVFENPVPIRSRILYEQEPMCTTAPVVVAPDPVQTEVKSEIPDFSPAVFENPVPIRSRILYEQEPICTTAPVVVAPDPVKTEVKSEIPDFSLAVFENPAPIRFRISYEQEPICTTAPVVVAPDPVQTEVKSEVPDFSLAVFENSVPIRSRILYEQEPICTTAPVVVAPDPVQTEVKSEVPDFSLAVFENSVPIRSRIIFEDDDYDFALPSQSLPAITKCEVYQPQFGLPSCPTEVVPGPSIEHAFTEKPRKLAPCAGYDDLIQPEQCLCKLCGMHFENMFLLLQHNVTHIHLNIYEFSKQYVMEPPVDPRAPMPTARVENQTIDKEKLKRRIAKPNSKTLNILRNSVIQVL